MNVDLIKKVVDPLNTFINKEGEMLTFSNDRGFNSLKIDESNFHSLPNFSRNNTIVAIDGGSNEILISANFCLGFVRIVALEYTHDKKASQQIEEFFVLIKSKIDDSKLSYGIEIFGSDLIDDFELGQDLVDVNGYKVEIDPSMILGISRRIAELKMVKRFADSNKLIVVDGSIKARFRTELNLLKELSKFSNIGFLSKTCRFLTKNSGNLSTTLLDLGPKSTWHYYPVFEITDKEYLGKLSFVKLNSKSKYVFRLEVSPTTDIDNYVLGLVLNSKDPIFVGYPYALISADRMARVTNREVDYLKTVFFSKIKNKEKLGNVLNTLNVHDILDKIS